MGRVGLSISFEPKVLLGETYVYATGQGIVIGFESVEEDRIELLLSREAVRDLLKDIAIAIRSHVAWESCEERCNKCIDGDCSVDMVCAIDCFLYMDKNIDRSIFEFLKHMGCECSKYAPPETPRIECTCNNQKVIVFLGGRHE